MENYNSLLFELSSEDRLDILLLLKKSPLKLSHIANKLNFTVQETSRNIARLSEAKLITKDPEGAFHLSAYGEEALNLLSGYRFLYKNKDYLVGHSLAGLPSQFRDSLGALENFTLVNDVMVTFHNIENMIADAEEHVWIMTNQVLVSTIPFLVQAVQRGVEFRLIMPKNYIPPEGLAETVSNPVFEKASRTKKLQNRFLEKTDVFLCLSEKVVAALGFPNLEGKLDYFGFRSAKESAVDWAKALYSYYWNRSTSTVPDQYAQTQTNNRNPTAV